MKINSKVIVLLLIISLVTFGCVYNAPEETYNVVNEKTIKVGNTLTHSSNENNEPTTNTVSENSESKE